MRMRSHRSGIIRRTMGKQYEINVEVHFSGGYIHTMRVNAVRMNKRLHEQDELENEPAQ